MAATKKPLIRYKILDACFKNPYKNFTIDVLLETVNQKLYDLYDNGMLSIKLRQLQDDIAFMRSAEGWSIELAELYDGKKRIYRYEDLNFSINNTPLNTLELNEFESAIEILSQFEGMPQFYGIQEILAKLKYDLKDKNNTQPFIGFDNNQDLKGLEYFSLLYHAVKNKTPLNITYKDFKTAEPYSFLFHPYYLKQYNNRWFLFGLHQAFEKYDYNVAIDRIEKVDPSQVIFIPNTQINWQDYFSDMIGVSKPIDGKIEEIVLQFRQLTAMYMINKPIHETQKHKWLNSEILEVKIKVIPNYELERFILSYGETVSVIKPIDLRNKIFGRLSSTIQNFPI